MKSFNQFLSESINISGDFNGTLIIGNDSPQQRVSEEFYADVVWQGSLYRMKIETDNGLPSLNGLSEQLQDQYPGAIVHNIYPKQSQNSLKIRSSQRYQPERLTWTD